MKQVGNRPLKAHVLPLTFVLANLLSSPPSKVTAVASAASIGVLFVAAAVRSIGRIVHG